MIRHRLIVELTFLFVAIAGGEDGGVARQQFDRQGFDPSYQRHRYPRAFDGNHPRDRRHSAMVLKQPEERAKRAGKTERKTKKERRDIL